MEPLNVVFMGTPDFAVPALKALAEHHIQAVFCQPDRPKGRSRKLHACPVKQAALEMNLTVHQPERIRKREWVAILRDLAPDVIVVAAYGQILSQKILDIPRVDCINIHASLLPRWRGASPIHHAILEGDEHTGVGIMKMLKGLDTGPVYAERSTPVADKGRVTLEAELAQMGAELLLETLPNLVNMTPKEQGEDGVTYASIIERGFGRIDFTAQDAFHVERMTRAYEEWPQVTCHFRDQPLKLLKVRAEHRTHQAQPGAVVEVTKKKLVIACKENTALVIDEVQPAGKKPQPIAAFINGHQPNEDELFT